MRFLACAVLLAADGCDPDPQPIIPLQQRPIAVEAQSERFTVTRHAKFLDDMAYGGERGVYLIKDRDTGREFLGISGIGISTLGSHTSGDDTVKDER